MRVRILTVPAPASPSDDAAWALRGAVEVERAVHVQTFGYQDLAETLPEVWAWLRDERYGRRLRFVAVVGEGERPRVVGSGLLNLPIPDNTHLGEAWVAVEPGFRRRGVGRALAEHVEREVRAAGRRLVHSWTDHAQEAAVVDRSPDLALVPPTGQGRVPLDHSSRFARSRGYVLEQAERQSVLDLPVEPARLERLHAAASTVAGAQYRLVTWADAAPDAFLDAYALLHTRMSTDTPLAGMEYEEDVFDAARARDFERTHRESGHRLLVAAAEHRPSGVLAAFTVLVVREGKPPAVFQDSTLVLREHRGHRLGMLVKVANVRALESSFPTAERVHTWNAVENEPMLAINVGLGFAPAGIQGQWQKRLT